MKDCTLSNCEETQRYTVFYHGYMFHFLAFSKIRVVEVWHLIVLMINMRSELVTIEENMFVCFCFLPKTFLLY